MKYISLLSALFALPLVASAHTRWFAESNLSPVVTTEPTETYLLVWGVMVALVVVVGIVIHYQHWLDLNFLLPKKAHVFERAASTFTMMAGAFFLIAGTHEYLFSPNMTHEVGIPGYLLVLEIVIGFAFLLGIFARVAAIGLGLVWVATFWYVEPLLVIENVWILSTAFFVLLMGNQYFSIVSFALLRSVVAPYKKYALSLLRLGTGFTLMILGLTEKILAPEFGINFLNQYHWNFMQLLGFNYSDYLFTLSAGSVEFLFGLIFVLGLVTRLNALVVAIVFTIPLFILGPIELAGHLPHFAAIVLLLMFGGGGHFTFFSDPKYKKIKWW